MYKILSITNRKLTEDFLGRAAEIASSLPDGIVLREKDLSEEEYFILAMDIKNICEKYEVPLIIHSFPRVAKLLKIKALHMPLHKLAEMTDEDRKYFEVLGASCHSTEDAVKAEKLGCTYITAGHIFATDCKKGLPPRGTEFLSEVIKSVHIPVYAIGGIDESNVSQVLDTGAEGICVMSSLMICPDTIGYMKKLREKDNEI